MRGFLSVFANFSVFADYQQASSVFLESSKAREAHHPWRGLSYLQAIMSDIPRKNGCQIAEHARQAHSYGMQRLLSAAVWDPTTS